jgi:hypothetical protein
MSINGPCRSHVSWVLVVISAKASGSRHFSSFMYIWTVAFTQTLTGITHENTEELEGLRTLHSQGRGEELLRTQRTFIQRVHSTVTDNQTSPERCITLFSCVRFFPSCFGISSHMRTLPIHRPVPPLRRPSPLGAVEEGQTLVHRHTYSLS